MNDLIQMVICDDDPVSLEKLRRELNRYREEKKVSFKIVEYTNPELLYYAITDGELSDIYVLDIQMPKYGGLELSELIFERNPKAEVVIVSAFSDYGVKAVNTGVRRYVTKDKLMKQLFPSLDIVFRNVRRYREDRYSRFWHSERRLVEKERILYIQKTGKYCDFTIEGEEDLRERMSITDVFEKLDSEAFLFIDRGIIANVPRIMSTEDSNALMSDGKKLPISRSRLKEVRAAIHEYWGERQ